MKLNIYILKLKDSCWYIGRTADVAKRVESHFKNQGSAWTKIHKPIALETTYTDANPFDEDKYVKQYMFQYGIDKVRGGTYSQPTLDPILVKVVQRELWGAQDLCFLCGRPHFVSKCYAKKDVNGNDILRFSELATVSTAVAAVASITAEEEEEPITVPEQQQVPNLMRNCVQSICSLTYNFFHSLMKVPDAN
jgi:hypothetical protein